MAFAIGDLVQLKSGGPWMTVVRLYEGTANLAWFDNSCHMHSVTGLDEAALQAPPPEAPEAPPKSDCPCGHSIPEHNEAGCLMGCAHEACESPAGQYDALRAQRESGQA